MSEICILLNHLQSTVQPVSSDHSLKTSSSLRRQVAAKSSSKAMQKVPVGAFCITFELLLAVTWLNVHRMEATTIRRRGGKVTVIEDREEETEKKPYQTSIRWSSAVCWSLLGTVVLLPIIAWILPCPIEPVAYSLPPPPEWTGPMAPNTHLQKAVRLYEGKVLGAESMVFDGEYMYAGTADGRIVEIYKGEIRTLTKLGKEPCGGFENEPTCGRPLGMRIDGEGALIVADAYLGLFKVNVATGDSTLLWPSTKPINGKLPKLLNDVEIGPDGLVYITDSSTRWGRRHNRYLWLEGEQTGRLLVYRPESGTMDELVSGLAFANGIQLTRDKQHLLVVSTTKAAVYKYGIAGANRGKLDVFNDNLPGLPDNIRKSSLGGYWVGIAVTRKPSFSLADIVAERPWLRTLVTKFLSQESIIKLAKPYGLLLHLNEAGEITMSLHDPDGVKVPSVSEAEDHNGVLYLGSYYLPYISKLYLSSVKK